MKRTTTIDRVCFQLPPPNAVTFTFQARDAIEISIPDDSMWRSKEHWHYKQIDARYIQVIQGELIVSTGFQGTIGGSSTLMREGFPPYECQLHERLEWCPFYDYDKDFKPIPRALSVRLIANEILHRNICSMVLDYDKFPTLSSTPIWLKILFRSLGPFPSTKQGLLKRLLRVQMVLTLHAHDYHEDHGRIPFQGMWLWIYPPEWTRRLEWRSMMWISYVVGATCYWVGRLAFGMSAVYPEYTPVVNEEKVENK